MTDAEITAMIRRMTLGDTPGGMSSTLITQAKTEAINFLAQLLVAASPESFEKKVSISPTNTNVPVYAMPSDNRMVKAVWDYDGSAGDITGAADNGSGLIRITHDLTVVDEQVVTIHDVAGCTEANGTWQIDRIDATTCDLVGSTFASAYTSGGKIFIEEEDTYQYLITRKSSKYQEANSETRFFYNESNLIIDDPDFTNDIIVLYRYLPTTLAEIPSTMHFGIYAFASIMLLAIPEQTDPRYGMLQKNLTLCQGLWDTAQGMARSYRPVLEASNVSSKKSVNTWGI